MIWIDLKASLEEFGRRIREYRKARTETAYANQERAIAGEQPATPWPDGAVYRDTAPRHHARRTGEPARTNVRAEVFDFALDENDAGPLTGADRRRVDTATLLRQRR